MQPTIFSGVTEDMRLHSEEVFGPVASITRFETLEEAVKAGNNTTYGLAAAVHTTNLKTAIKASNGLRAGTVGGLTGSLSSPLTCSRSGSISTT